MKTIITKFHIEVVPESHEDQADFIHDVVTDLKETGIPVKAETRFKHGLCVIVREAMDTLNSPHEYSNRDIRNILDYIKAWS